MESKKNVQVYLRVRPQSTSEETHSCERLTCLNDPSGGRGKSVKLLLTNSNGSATVFSFDDVFPPDSTQEEVYESFGQRAVCAALNGEHGVLIAYGQTGSGKTHTIACTDPSQEGVIPRAIRDVWNQIQAVSDTHTCEVALSVVEIYQDVIYDLTKNSKPVVAFHRLEEAMQPVAEYGKTLALIQTAFQRREVGSTAMNSVSSRSHLVLTLSVLKKPITGTGVILDGRLTVCDLAGSERFAKTMSTGVTHNEGLAINLSLLALGNAVAALSAGGKFMNYRDSTLTRVLREALEGRGDTSIIVTVSPTDFNTRETWYSIQFGQRARALKQQSERHQILNYKNLYQDALGDISALQENIKELNAFIQTLQNEIAHLRRHKVDDAGGDTAGSPKDSVASSTPQNGGIRGGATAEEVEVRQNENFAALGALLDELRQESEAKDEHIFELEEELRAYEDVFEKELKNRCALQLRHVDTLSQISALQDALHELQARSLQASRATSVSDLRGPSASPRRPQPASSSQSQKCCTLM